MKRPLKALAAVSLLAATAAATAPSTQPDPAAYASPEKTWASICDALKDGDLARFRAGFHNNSEVSRLFMDAYSDVTVATFDLARATALLGEKGRAMGAKFESVHTDLVQNGLNRKAQITGDRAKWVRNPNPNKNAPSPPDDVIHFKKIKGNWLIDTDETYELNTNAGRAAAEKMIETVPPMTQLLKTVAADIRSGKIKTVEEMRRALSSK